MPGIVGFISRMPRECAEPRLCAMVQAIKHEAFYEVGTWIDEAAGLYVGWTVPKDSFSYGMPFRSATGDVTLIFSGEEYSASRSTGGAGECGEIRGGSAASLVQSYERDPNFPIGLNGLFHGLVFDRKRGTALLFNDRYGMHRLCYHQAKDALYFAAEAKAILAVLPELRELNEKSLGEFLACSCVLEDRTLFRNIQVMPAGSVWSLQGCTAYSKARYFSPTDMGTAGASGSRAVLLRTSRSVGKQSLFVFRRQAAHWHRPYRRHGYSSDHGLAQGCPRNVALLHIWRNVPRLP